jgi:hypothetical protein
MSNTVTFAGNGGKIVIEVIGYEIPAPSGADLKDGAWDANWLSARLKAEAGSFCGTFWLSLQTPELTGLCAELERATDSMSGQATFTNLENDLKLTISFGQRGAAEIAGVLTPGGSSPGTLHFQFQSDQSYLVRSVEDLKCLTRQFPFRGDPRT